MLARSMDAHVVVIHYDEIGLKGGNRRQFEESLLRNLKQLCRPAVGKVEREYGYLVAELEEGADLAQLRRRLELIPGIANFMFAVPVALDPEAIAEAAVRLAGQSTFETFKVQARRSNKQFPLDSLELNRLIGAAILEKVGGKVRLEEPDLTVHVEIGFREAYIGVERYRGVGGLPVGTAGKLMALVSGGIDSPVAAHLMMRRGVKVDVAHFQNETQVRTEVETKIQDLCRVLAGSQGPTTLYIVPFADLQFQIIASVPAKLRMIVYRRFMLRIATELARSEGAKGLIVGDSLSQVASQTLDNLHVTYAATPLNVYAPLMGLNKNETIELAKRIGTYEISIRPYGDCCTFLVSEHPETHARLEVVEAVESRLDVEGLVRKAVTQARRQIIDPEPLSPADVRSE
ncbi:MAG: tRNA 4-thiouridine(8) synthase ThiI [candidate division KSB1 bacterium]|nr:tRNA 4-thiouridine(8) synthase ThiI [candidate division KSB1 bacterium]